MYFSMVVWIASMLRNIGFVFRAGLIHCTGWGILLCADMNPGASYVIHEKFIIIYPPPFWKILKKRFPDFVLVSNRIRTAPAGSCTVYVEQVKWFPDVHNLPCCWHIWYESNHVDHPFRNDLNGSDLLIHYFIFCVISFMWDSNRHFILFLTRSQLDGLIEYFGIYKVGGRIPLFEFLIRTECEDRY